MDLGLFALSLGRPACPLRAPVFAQVMTTAAVNGAEGRARTKDTEGTEFLLGCRTFGPRVPHSTSNKLSSLGRAGGRSSLTSETFSSL
jgi:hypothetical protein